MREIKFRAWEKDTKTMWDVRELDFACGEAYVGGCYKSLKNLVLVQYTGLKDKNGKEIYEGDILYEDAWGYDSKTGKKIVVQVCFGRLGFEFLPKKTQVEYGWGNYVYHPCEIIGNLYENPELLK